MVQLIVNLDPLALLRESRRTTEPDPAAAAVLAVLAGANGVSIGLRSDRRHGTERDLQVLREVARARFQVRVPPSPEAMRIVTPTRPDAVVLVPERPEAVGHESGFDLAMGAATLGEAAAALREAGLPVLVLIDPEREQVKAAHRLGFSGVSLCGARLGSAQLPESTRRELESLEDCARLADRLGLETQVSGGLDLAAVRALASLNALGAVEVGHALLARAALLGIERSVGDFRAALRPGT